LITTIQPFNFSTFKQILHTKFFFFTNEFDIIENCDAVFSCVGTPSLEDGSCDLSYVYEVAHTFGKKIKKRSLLINKSTVPVGTADKVYEIIKDELKQREEEIEFDVVSNPEFLQEGCAIENFTNPERIVIGCDSDYAKVVMLSIYKTYPDEIIVNTSIKSAEMIKYAANAMLATRISFINDIANLCDAVGANVKDVAKGIGLDSRIGKKFLNDLFIFIGFLFNISSGML
jgi:UDPglucose 6-dehydrogenase